MCMGPPRATRTATLSPYPTLVRCRHWRERARLHVQMLEVEAPARRLAAAMLAHDAVEPAFKTAGQVEISPVDRQHQRAIEHARIEPVAQDQLDPERPPLRVAPFLPPPTRKRAASGKGV